VAIPIEAIGKRLFVRIGCHSDVLWDKEIWVRCPEITTVRPLNDRITRVASPFGGLIYIEVVDGCQLGSIPVGVRGAVEAPYFVLGSTSRESWKKIRQYPAPWAELATDRVILSVPSTSIRDLDDPEPLLQTWNDVLDACADLAAIPRRRRRPERYVADEQIAAGYMHSGYPMMAHLDAVPSLTRLNKLHEGNWGLFHELGHNHQSGDWTFASTGEVTCNIFTLHVLETICHAEPPAWIHGEGRDQAYRKYAATGPDFRVWQSDAALSLTMYYQLREGFGWEAYQRVFAEYRSLPEDQRPTTDEQKRDQWLIRFSRAVHRNLGPFFEAWGIPASASARAAVADLPVWMPEGFPPAK
jgi:hypothetical protein